MTESLPPVQTPPSPAGDGASASFGAILRAARERARMDVPTLAARLRLHVKQVEALERCDLAALPSLIYVRGFLRSCARELKIDPRLLLEDLERRAGVQAGNAPPPAGGSLRLARFGDGTKPIVAVLLVVLMLAGLVGTLVPRRQSAPASPTPPQAAPVVAGSAPGATDSPAGAGDAPAAAVAAPAAVAGDGARDLATPPPPPVAPAGAAAAPSASPEPSPATAISPEPPGKAPRSQQVPAVTSHAADSAELVLRVHSQAWVEVVQSDGVTLLSQICLAGTVQTIKGKEPLHVVIGNSAAVEAQFRGVVVDLNRYASPNGVARLTLE
ncbi:putative Cytoskeleton protein RodZ [Burkholderiales bacterium]|nr:putative Cytoskeleton protein RodZ [Burkholderiales bacterium]